ncbi:hypothetical protein GCM10009557_09960 [Virgisporangium ochraceum]|uniref:Uncharacterized protein n=1 Tax=Virgisporangium ochraceum TaxID=65505 RepID=A0A8J3ZW93_9ACTN|nr:hypothetical protein [Virgisporangium ochraceum]GIJ71297.1 hypothetical protein Voc01_062140 [Virgisporangium ochraceum]
MGLDTRVYARSRRIGRRRRGLPATGVALALAITTPVALRPMPEDTVDRSAGAPALEPYTAPPPTVPVRVTHLPPQVSGVQPLVRTWPGGSGLRYHASGHGPGTVPMIWVNVQAADPRTEKGTEAVGDTTVHGQPATVIKASMGDWRGIAWQRTPDAWTVVWGDVSAPAAPRADGEPTQPGTRLPVGRRTGWLDRTGTGPVLRVPVGDGTLLRVRAPLPDTELVTLAEGITVTPGFRPTGG